MLQKRSQRIWTVAAPALVILSGLAYVSGSWISASSHADMTGAMAMTGNPMPMITAAAEDSFTPKRAPLSSSGWTAVASDQQRGSPASNAIDGNPATIWSSRFSPTAVALPHSITIDMHATNYVSELTYLPRQDTSSNGNIGQYSISVSMDGIHWGAPVVTGTWADDTSGKTAVFGSVSARYVRLTAFTEAGNRGPWSSAAEIGLLGGEPPIGPALARTGWTASADSEDSATYAAANVLDGNGTTIWQTAFTGTVPPLPHSITIDMHSTHLVSGLSYLPRQ